MQNLNKKQKIILSILASIIIISIGYYVYSKDEKYEELEIDENIQISNGNNNTNINNEQLENQEEEKKETIVVHVSGAVNKEGIVELEADSRIADAIEKAEGVTQEAVNNEINLAYKLEDGMKIHIPTAQEYEEQKKQKEESNGTEDIQYITTNSGLNDESDKNSNNSNIVEKNSKVNINTATQTELETLPGIGPSTSAKIIEFREKNGKFKSIEDLKNVSGIGDVKFDNIKDKIEI